jgi:DNA-binding MarR family transcriptional regulator
MGIAMPGVEKHELGQLLMFTLQDFQQRLDSDLESTGFPGVRYRHRALFMHLERYGASRSVDLAEASGIRPQSMMKIVHELEELGLISRRADPTDSRAKLIEFTAGGGRLIEQLKQSTEKVWEQYSELLGEKELRRLLSAMSELLSRSSERGVR